jgi:hypothetical protein
MASPQFSDLTSDSQYQYRRCFDIARAAWGSLPSGALLPHHMQAMMDKLAGTPSKANNFLAAMGSLSRYARPRKLLLQNITEGVERFERPGGHKPWTP